MSAICLLLAVLSIWDYPARYPAHESLRRQFIAAVKGDDAVTMEATSRKGVDLLPDDPVWHYNLACSLAHFDKREEEAFDELEKAIDLGFRDRATIAADRDLKRLAVRLRYEQLLEYADFMKSRPLFTGPLAAVDATGEFGKSVALGEQNLGWDFDCGCFEAKLRLSGGVQGASAGDLYMNRDGRHSQLARTEFPGLTWVTLDSDGTNRMMHLDFPNILFPYPAFGNCSRALVNEPNRPNPFWRSLPRAMMTTDQMQLGRMLRLYLSNQTWVFPANADIAPIGTNGDVFASLTPYCLTTAGRSWSDLPYLRAALEASRSLDAKVKAGIVAKGLLAPVIQTLIRKSLAGVTNEVAYLTAAAHPTAFPAKGVELKRLKAAASRLTADDVPPLVPISVTPDSHKVRRGGLSELTYATPFAWAYVLRADADVRTFVIKAKGADEYAFVQTHGDAAGAKVERLSDDSARVTVFRSAVSPTNRIDVTVVGRSAKTGWGAPSYVSFARMDPAAPYSDPALTERVRDK